jgi:hypothetical protein
MIFWHMFLWSLILHVYKCRTKSVILVMIWQLVTPVLVISVETLSNTRWCSLLNMFCRRDPQLCTVWSYRYDTQRFCGIWTWYYNDNWSTVLITLKTCVNLDKNSPVLNDSHINNEIAANSVSALGKTNQGIVRAMGHFICA